MELTQLIQFKTIADTGNMSKAAERLFVSQPALSKSVRRLEEELGVPLFNHKKNRIELNDMGELMLLHVNKILAEVEAMREEAVKTLPLKARLRLCSNVKGHLRYAFFTLTKQYPDMQVDIDVLEEEVCWKELETGCCDFVFLQSPAKNQKFGSVYMGVLRGAISVSLEDSLSVRSEILLSELADRELYIHQAYGPLTKRLMDKMEELGMAAQLHPIVDDIMYASYFQNQNGALVFTSNLMENYLHSDDRKLVTVMDEEVSMEIWLSFQKANEQSLMPFIKRLQKQFALIC